MFQTLDTIIGLVFVFLMFSLVVSAALEVVAAVFRLRSKALEAGVRALLMKLGGPGLDASFWAHPFIEILQPSGRAPSYIPTSNMAAALLHIASGNSPGTVANIATLGAGPGNATTPALNTIIATVINESGPGATLVQIQANLEKWLNGSMQRISSLYQRNSRMYLFAIALFLAGVMNIDAVTIWQRIAGDQALRDSLVEAAGKMEEPKAKVLVDTPALVKAREQVIKAEEAVKKAAAAGVAADIEKAGKTLAQEKAALEQLSQEESVRQSVKEFQVQIKAFTDLGLPIGWGSAEWWPDKASINGFFIVILHLLGLVASALAASLGAPFWFDTLQRIMNVRSTIKPQK